MPTHPLRSQIDLHLERIHALFDTEKIRNQSFSGDLTRHYYKVNRIPYTRFHSASGFLHCGITRDGIYKEEDLLELARTVEANLSPGGTGKLLELACGRGANTSYLASRHPELWFNGLDLSETNLTFAEKVAQEFPNFHPVQGDYHDLSRYEDASMDVVFQAEALCYSTHVQDVFREIMRVLRAGGLFISFDAYRARKPEAMEPAEALACELAEKGMAVERMEVYEDYRNKALATGFEVVQEEDATALVVPTLRRFEHQAHRFFSRRLRARILKLLLPNAFLYNAVSGYLMSLTIQTRLHVYMISIYRKPE
jgi:ubiquinone/menaquinone biosynthesis C-methylase UbiE